MAVWGLSMSFVPDTSTDYQAYLTEVGKMTGFEKAQFDADLIQYFFLKASNGDNAAVTATSAIAAAKSMTKDGKRKF